MTSEKTDNVHQPSRALSPVTGDLEHYSFPERRLKRVMDDPNKTPLLLVACGSFSPITYLHLRLFEVAADYVKFSTDFEIIGGYLSPVSDAYRKAGLASAEHRYDFQFASRLFHTNDLSSQTRNVRACR
jgi:nicotinamide mononucleotide adenylyltransferase